MATSLALIPDTIVVPARLQTPEARAEAAAENAAAAGGIRTGGYPQIDIKNNQFNEKEGGERRPYLLPAVAGQPQLPMMCLEIAVLASNPGLSKTYYPGKWQEGSGDEPTCRSGNGITPDNDAPAKQSATCALCPQNQWGSKISEISGKPIKACDDGKQLAVLPAGDLGYKMLGLHIGKGSLTNWGKYVQALGGRGYNVKSVVTNVTFDSTKNGTLQFTLNRFLNDEEAVKCAERGKGDDVRTIVAPVRSAVTTPLAQLPPPPPPAIPADPPVVAPDPVPAAVFSTAVQQAAATATETLASGSTPPANAPLVVPERTKRPRRTRAQMIAAGVAAASVPLASPPSPPMGAYADILAKCPPALKPTLMQVGLDSDAGKALIATFMQPSAPAGQPVQPTPAPAATPLPTVSSGFGAPAVPVADKPASPAVVAAGESLASKLAAALGAPS